MASTYGQGRKLPPSSATQTGFLQENEDAVDGVEFVDALSASYTPAVGADWPNPDPTTIQEALDQLAARLNVLEP